MPLLPLSIPQDLDKHFYNREKDLRKLKHYLNALNENISEQILVTGLRGVGKTYLLKKLLKELPDNILVTYIDISKVYGNQRGKINEELIMHSLLDSMNHALRGKESTLKRIYNKINDFLVKISIKEHDFKEAGGILGIAVPETKDNYEKLSHFVMEFPQKVVDASKGEIKGFIIVIDEFQLLGELENPNSFFWLIRSYTQEQDNVSYIFTGSISKTSEIVEMINGGNGVFGGRMIQVSVDPFTREETDGYLKERVSEINFTEDVFERFYERTRGVPAIINSFCNTLSAGEVYDASKIKETFFEKMDQITVMWIRIWGTLNEKEKEIMISIAQNGPQSWSELEKSVEFSRMTFTKYLDILKNKGLVTFTGESKYKIADRMLEGWIKYKKEVDGYYPP
ncbi:MAG: ATP-binding protein [Methanobacteriaceae archaeon]|jgi:AAA+ ATPase superfamily predicted ATPase